MRLRPAQAAKYAYIAASLIPLAVGAVLENSDVYFFISAGSTLPSSILFFSPIAIAIFFASTVPGAIFWVIAIYAVSFGGLAYGQWTVGEIIVRSCRRRKQRVAEVDSRKSWTPPNLSNEQEA